jgi:3-phosphoinositide dependent protein kinase-1
MEDYDFGEILGQGRYSTVFLATERSTGKHVVIKKILKSEQPRIIRAARKEALISKILGCHHKNIICVTSSFEDDEAIYIVSEYISGAVTLQYYLPDMRTKEGQLEILDIFQQLADGLDYIHSKGIVHNDIKLENVIIKGTIPFYIDFNLSCIYQCKNNTITNNTYRSYGRQYECTKSQQGTPFYMSPETVLSLERDHRQSDIYSLGALFYRLIFGIPPYHKKTLVELYQSIVNDPLPQFQTGIPQLDDLMLKMLSKKQERPTATEVRDRLNEIIRQI